MNRTFIKSFITKCPASCFSSVLLPVLRQLCPFMLVHLKERWSYLKKVRENPNFDEENTDSQEVLDDVIIRVMAREYIDTVKAVLTSGRGSDVQNENSNPVDGPASLSLLGEQALADGTLSTCLVGTCLAALSWPDSPAFHLQSTRPMKKTEVEWKRIQSQPQVEVDQKSQLKNILYPRQAASQKINCSL